MKKLSALCALLFTCVALIGCPPSQQEISNMAQNISAANSASAAHVETGTAIAIIIDTSGSMTGQKMDDAKRVYRDIIFPRLVSAREPVEYSLISCGGSASVIRANALLESDTPDSVDALRADGGTPLGEAILAGYQQLSASRRESKYIFIISDGQATGATPSDVITAFQQQGVNCGIFVIGFQSDSSYYEPISALGGRVMMVENAQGLADTCDLLFKKILKVEAE